MDSLSYPLLYRIAATTFAIMMLTCISSSAQLPEIAAERAGHAVPPSLVPPGLWQLEAAYVYSTRSLDYPGNRLTITTLAIPSALLRIGLLKSVELRIEDGFEQVTTTNSFGGGTEISDVSALSVGTKIFMTAQDDALPAASFLASLKLPVGGQKFIPTDMAPTFLLAMRHDLSRFVSFNYNIGGRWNGDTARGSTIYSLAIGLTYPRRNLSGFIELYGSMAPGVKQVHAVDAGIAWAVAANIQLDLYGGLGITEVAPDETFSFGVAWRFPE